ncbi:hypothetical protein [Dolichospermum sp. UHCC 0259]|uniref:hypothetical protein n=1 Tax=Dolichospermum sp. UHCC 0259 TaxID=2590010 RepID=UPI00144728BC|nr:hypothetical protein [Dolichospermum sp. UHCC 0259]MTJ50641.1 hypothetical protein [Dolichospermum sp. UHCC 0259]
MIPTEFKNEIIAELDIDYQDLENKATLSTSLVMVIHGKIENKWQFLEKIILKDKPDLSYLNDVFERYKNKHLNKPQIDYSDVKDPDDIPF